MDRRISVVIPTWNRASLLPITLDAVLGQTRPPHEVIVVDDGSTDNTLGMLEEKFGARICVLSVPNGGDIAARNIGLARARGELVGFCDSDDLWQPDFLERMSALWDAEPRMRVAFSDFSILRDGVSLPGTKFNDAPPGFWDGLRPLGDDLGVFDAPIITRVISYQPFFPSCMVADRAFLNGIGGWDQSTGRVVTSDFATLLRLAEHAPFGVVRKPLVRIRKHAGNLSADVQAMNLADAAVLEGLLASRPLLRPHAALINASIACRRASALHTAFARQDHGAVRAIFPLLPATQRQWKARLKAGVAGLPSPVRGVVAKGLLALGSLRGSAP